MTARTDIKLMNGFSTINWYFKEKNLLKDPTATAKFHGALVMFVDIHNLDIGDVIDTLINHNDSGHTKPNA